MCVSAQNDAFFYEDYDRVNRDGSMGFSFDNFSNGEGFGFGNFNGNLNGMGFGGFGDGGGGYSFCDFGFEGDDAPLDGGPLLLCGLAILRLKPKGGRRKEVNS